MTSIVNVYCENGHIFLLFYLPCIVEFARSYVAITLFARSQLCLIDRFYEYERLIWPNSATWPISNYSRILLNDRAITNIIFRLRISNLALGNWTSWMFINLHFSGGTGWILASLYSPLPASYWKRWKPVLFPLIPRLSGSCEYFALPEVTTL